MARVTTGADGQYTGLWMEPFVYDADYEISATAAGFVSSSVTIKTPSVARHTD
jgi:hypothetical protein